MSLLSILIILAYLIWSYRVVFKLNWSFYDSINERIIWVVLTCCIILFILLVLIMVSVENGYLDFLTKPLW